MLDKFLNKHKSDENDSKQESNNTSQCDNLTKSLNNNISLFKNIFKDDETFIKREFENKQLKAAKCCIIYIDGMVDTEIVNRNIIEPILQSDLSNGINIDDLLEEFKKKVIFSNNVTMQTEVNKIVSSVIYGDTLFLLDGYDKALIIDSKGWQTRSITEPDSTKIIRGPREGFTESIATNLTLVRRKIKSPELKFKFGEIGTKSHTKICICYIEGLALESILKELEFRLSKIDIDGIIDSGYIQELIKDAPFSPFETIGASEKPDIIAAKLLEGRIALFVDGSPFVLTVPFVVIENFQSSEDYYVNYIFATINRLIRGFTAVTCVTIPAIYLSAVTYHQEMLPTPLLLSISASRQDVPIPTVVSLFLMLFVFDIMREAGIRMPAPVGQAINIIGSIVLGQAAIEAKLVSAPVLIVTAITGIMQLVNMNLIGVTIVYRTFLLIGAAFLGFYGFFICFIILYLHIMSIRSFGVPYALNSTRVLDHEGQDFWIRAPWWTMTLRPKIIAAKSLVRQSSKYGKEK